jgi:squalene cyclase
VALWAGYSKFVSQSVCAVTTKYPRLGDLKRIGMCFSQFWKAGVRIKVLAGLMSSEGKSLLVRWHHVAASSGGLELCILR